MQVGSSQPHEVLKGMVRCRGEYVPPRRCGRGWWGAGGQQQTPEGVEGGGEVQGGVTHLACSTSRHTHACTAVTGKSRTFMLPIMVRTHACTAVTGKSRARHVPHHGTHMHAQL